MAKYIEDQYIPKLDDKKDHRMLSEKQEALIDKLEIAWGKHPEWRFGQLIYNILWNEASGRLMLDKLFYYDDDKVIAKLQPYTKPS